MTPNGLGWPGKCGECALGHQCKVSRLLTLTQYGGDRHCELYADDVLTLLHSNSVYQTAAVLQFFVLAMTLNSDVVRRAQAELDMVVGRDRLPTFQDRHTLPYIRAIVKETLRTLYGNGSNPCHSCLCRLVSRGANRYVSKHSPVARLSPTHPVIRCLAKQDDWYDGYLIPKGMKLETSPLGLHFMSNSR
jgi:hypothetical protein